MKIAIVKTSDIAANPKISLRPSDYIEPGLQSGTLQIGGLYNWKGQPERLRYIGMCEPHNGRWHQFEKVDEPGTVWCEVLPTDLHMLEVTPPTKATPDLTCKITIHNVHGWQLDAGMTEAVLKRCARELGACDVIDVYPQERVPEDAPAYKHPGWIEWIIRLHSAASNTWLTVGCIQRQPGDPYEFHS